jgi:hypothetical protein
MLEDPMVVIRLESDLNVILVWNVYYVVISLISEVKYEALEAEVRPRIKILKVILMRIVCLGSETP